MAWIRVETNWQHDPYVIMLDGVTRHVLNTIWCLAGEKGVPTHDADREPLHAELPLEYLEPSYLAREAGLDPSQIRSAMERLRSPIEGTEWSPEIPPRLVVDLGRGVAIVRNVGKYQKQLLKDRARKAKADSTESMESSAEVNMASTETHANERTDGRNGTNGSKVSQKVRPDSAPPLFDAFWSAYPRRVKRKQALRLFSGLSPGAQAEAVRAATHYAEHFRATGKSLEFALHPSTFLSKRDEHWREWVSGSPEPAFVETRKPNQHHDPSLDRLFSDATAGGADPPVVGRLLLADENPKRYRRHA